MTVIIDASTMVAALVDGGSDGRWAETVLSGGDLVAPHIMPAEVANVMRRAESAGTVTTDTVALAHRDLLDLPIQLVGYEPVGNRAWELRGSINAYDAWYVALAEWLDGPLATLDQRLVAAPGPRCQFMTPRHA